MDDDDNALGSYVSSVEPFAPEKGKPSVDAADEAALKRLMRVVESQIKLYHTISGMKRFDTEKFDAEEREELCSEYVKLLNGLKQLIVNAIDGIKESARHG